MEQQEVRQFTVHTNILYSVIKNQAGTLAKALLESLMNAIDANATSFNVTLTLDSFLLVDDGKGFQTEEEIIKWFGEFGHPHEEGDATYGKFRIGRGQLFAFAVNTWRTGRFEMEVDFRNKGLDYVLKKGLRPKKGCHIEGKLYKPMTESELGTVEREFEALVKYSQIPVRLNGKTISKRPNSLTWDMDTDDAYIKVSRGDNDRLEVYNLGVLVRSYSSYEFGCGGTIVSKKTLSLNTARNDILKYDCEVWARIERYLKKINLQKVASRKSLNKDERGFLAEQFAYGEMGKTGLSPMDLKMVTDVSGRHHSLRELLSRPRISVVNEAQARRGEMLHRQGAAFVLPEDTLRRFNCSTLSDFLELVQRRAGVSQLPEAVSFGKLAQDFTEDYSTLALDQVTMEERMVIEVIVQHHAKFFKWFSMEEKSSGIRELRFGSSNVAKAWTDGETYITFDMGMIRRVLKKGAAAYLDLLHTLTHEYVHDTADLESHTHDLVFYNKYHDIIHNYGAGWLMKLALDMDKALTKMLTKANLAPQRLAANESSKAGTSRPATPAQIRDAELRSRQMKLAL